MWLERYGDIDQLAFYIFCAVSAVLIILCLILIFLPCCVAATRGVSPGSSIDFYIAIGGRLLAFTVLVRGLDPTWLEPRTLDTLCEMFPCALLLGLTMLIGGVFIKAITIYSFKWNKHLNALESEWKPNIAMWVLLILIGLVSVVWSVLYTPAGSEISNMRYDCNGPFQFEWQVSTSGWHGFLLLVTIVFAPLQCKASRQTPASPESTALTVVHINMLLAVVTGLCVRFLFDGTPTLMYAVDGGLMMWVILFSDLMLLTGRVISARTYTEPDCLDERYDTIKAESGRSILILPME